MNATALLERLHAMDVHLFADGDRLRVDAPRGALDPALIAELQRAKPDLLALLRAPRTAPTQAPLTAAQRQLWLHARMLDGPVYNESVTVHLGARADIAALSAALDMLVARHPALRTTFHLAGDSAVARIGEAFSIGLSTVDLRDEREPDAAYRAHAEAVLRAPFDLARGPLLRAVIAHLPAGDRLFLAFHHLAMDGVSLFRVFVPELRAAYEARVRGESLTLPRLSPTKPAPAPSSEHRAFWAHSLANSVSTPLPTSASSAITARAPGAQHRFALPAELHRDAVAWARAEGVTLYLVLATAISVLLRRRTEQDDVCLGTVTAGRRPQDEGHLGHFLNTLVLRSSLRGECTAREALALVRRASLDAWAHQDVPFDEVTASVTAARGGARSPLFHTAFVFEPIAEQHGPWSLERWDVHTNTARFDVMFEVQESAEGLAGRVEYDAARHDADAIASLVVQLETVLRAMISAPQTPIARLPIVAPSELAQLASWSEGPRHPALPLPAPQLVAQQALATPDAIAVIDGARSLTYRELLSHATSLAARLRALDVGRDVPVGLALERSLELAVAVLGVGLAGAAYVPLDVAYPTSRLEMMIEDANVRVLVTQSWLEQRVPVRNAAVVRLDSLEAQPPAPTVAPWDAPSLQDLAYVIFTSGSTGRPKGVAMHHGPLANLIRWQNESSAMGVGDRTLQFAPVSFDVHFQEMFATWSTGGALVMVPDAARRDLRALLRIIEETSAARLFLPFVALATLCDVALESDAVPTSLREVITAGEQLRVTGSIAAFFARVSGCTLHNHYGPSETHVVTAFTLAGDPARWPVLPPIGRPLPGVGLHVLDAAMEPVPPGAPGALYLSGDALARGYYQQPELTAERFLEGAPHATRMYKTGDVVRFRNDGALEFLGRVDHQVKIRGHRVEPGEVEAVLERLDGVRDAKIIAHTDSTGATTLLGYVVPTDGGAASERATAWRRALAERLPEYMVPAQITVLPSLPLTPSGKVDTRALPRPTASASTARRSPRDALELRLQDLWTELFAGHRPALDDDFFALGGHSLLAVRLMTLVQSRLGYTLPLSALFEAPTIEALAARIRRAGNAPAHWSAPITIRGGKGTPFFCVPGSGGNALYLRELAQRCPHAGPFLALQPRGVDDPDAPFDDFVALASHFVRSIREAQPEGPYYLGGHSTGGVVAFEIARQLEAAGETVARVVLMDIPAPQPGNGIGQGWSEVTWLHSIARLLGRLGGRDLSIDAATLAPLDSDARYALLHARLVSADLLPPDSSPSRVRRIAELMIAHDTAYARFSPAHSVRAAAVLLRAETPLVDDELGVLTQASTEPAWGWSAHFTQPVRVCAVAGDHLTMMSLPHVESLAVTLGEALRE